MLEERTLAEGMTMCEKQLGFQPEFLRLLSGVSFLPLLRTLSGVDDLVGNFLSAAALLWNCACWCPPAFGGVKLRFCEPTESSGSMPG